MSTTSIEWTDAVWNPTTGCDKISAGCENCYALTMAKRLKAMGQANYQTDGDPRTSGPGFGFAAHPHTLDIPGKWKKPRRIFVNSMSDLFHVDALKAEVDGRPFLAEVFARMAANPHHTFQVLTKRPEIMQAVLSNPRFILDVNSMLLRDGHPVIPGGMTDRSFRWPAHIWLGTSIELNRFAIRDVTMNRLAALQATPAGTRFLSLEPLLGPLPNLRLTGIDWVIVGGESGRGARPMHPAWARDIRDRCIAAGVPFLFKQWGAWSPAGTAYSLYVEGEIGTLIPCRKTGASTYERCSPGSAEWFYAVTSENESIRLERSSKHAAGRELDGRTWDEYPA